MPTTIHDGSKARNVSLDALRAFVTLLVVAHHAALAYITLVPRGATAFTAAQGIGRLFL